MTSICQAGLIVAILGVAIELPAFGEFNYLEMKGVHGMLKAEYRDISPIHGFTALKTGALSNVRFFGNYGPAVKEIPCHFQLLENEIADHCPQDWTSAYIQHLFPSPDGQNFAANQSSLHDPVSRLSPELIGKLLLKIKHTDSRELRTNKAYFLQIRTSLVDLIYNETFEGGNSKPQGGRPNKISIAYQSGIEKMISNCNRPVDFIDGFYKLNDEIRGIANNNPDLLKKRRETENFVNSLLSALIESQQPTPLYPKNLVVNALLAYFWQKFDGKSSFLKLYSGMPDAVDSKFLAWLENSPPKKAQSERESWLQDKYSAEDYWKWKESFDHGSMNSKQMEEFLSDPERAAFYSYSSHIYEDPLPPPIYYGKAAHSSLGKDPKSKRTYNTHSDCGESLLRYLFNVVSFRKDPSGEGGYFDASILKEMAIRHKLNLDSHLFAFYLRNKDIAKVNEDRVRDEWTQNVVSNLNTRIPGSRKVDYWKPKNNPVCELAPHTTDATQKKNVIGLENILNVLEKLLGDNSHPHSGSLDLRLDRFCKIFTRPGFTIAWRLKSTGRQAWLESGHPYTIAFTVTSGTKIRTFDLEFQPRHFSISTGQPPEASWPTSTLTKILKTHPAPGKRMQDSRIDDSTMTWLLSSGRTETLVPALAARGLEDLYPNMLYSLPLKEDEARVRALRAVVSMGVAPFYPAANRWIQDIPEVDSTLQAKIARAFLEFKKNSRQSAPPEDLLQGSRRAIYSAVREKNDADFEFFVENGLVDRKAILTFHGKGDEDEKEVYGDSAWTWTLKNGTAQQVERLWKLGGLSSDDLLTGRSGALHYAVQNTKHSREVIRLLIRLGGLSPSQVMKENHWKYSPLRLAMLHKQVDAVAAIVQEGKLGPAQLQTAYKPYNVPGRPCDGDVTILHEAVLMREPETIRAIAEAGRFSIQDLSPGCKDGTTPTQLAAILGRALELDAFINRKGVTLQDIFSVNPQGETLLHLAAKQTDPETLKVVKYLLSPKELEPAQILIENNQGMTALDVAAAVGRIDAVEAIAGKLPSKLIQSQLSHSGKWGTYSDQVKAALKKVHRDLIF